MPPNAECSGSGTGLRFGDAVQSAANTGGNADTDQRCLARSDCLIIKKFSLAILVYCVCV